MKWKYFIGWLSLLVIAFINGAFRQIVFQNSLGDLRAHQLSTAIGISLFASIFIGLSDVGNLSH